MDQLYHEVSVPDSFLPLSHFPLLRCHWLQRFLFVWVELVLTYETGVLGPIYLLHAILNCQNCVLVPTREWFIKTLAGLVIVHVLLLGCVLRCDRDLSIDRTSLADSCP